MKVRVVGNSSEEVFFLLHDRDQVELVVALSDYDDADDAQPDAKASASARRFSVQVAPRPILRWKARPENRDIKSTAIDPSAIEVNRDGKCKYVKIHARLPTSRLARNFCVQVAWGKNVGSTEVLLLHRTNAILASVVGWLAVLSWGLAMLLLLPAWSASGLEGPLVRIFGGLVAGGALTLVSRLFASSHLPHWGLFHRLRIALPALTLSLAVVILPSVLFVRVWNNTALALEIQVPTGDMVLPPKSETLLWRTTFPSFEPALTLRYGQQICKTALSEEAKQSDDGLKKLDQALPPCSQEDIKGESVSGKVGIHWLASKLGYTTWASLGCKDAFTSIPEQKDGRWTGKERRAQLLQDDCKPIEGTAQRKVDVRWLRDDVKEHIRGTATVQFPFSLNKDRETSFAPVFAPNFNDGGLLVWQSGVADPDLPIEIAVSLDAAGNIPVPKGGNPAWKLMDSGRRYERGTLRVLRSGAELRHLSVDHALLTAAEVCCAGEGLSSPICQGTALASDYVGAAGARDAWVVVPSAECRVHVHLTPEAAATKLSLTTQCQDTSVGSDRSLTQSESKLDAEFCGSNSLKGCDRCGAQNLVAHLPEGIAFFPKATGSVNAVALSRQEVEGGSKGLWLKLVLDDQDHSPIWEHTVLTDVVWQSAIGYVPWDGSKVVTLAPSNGANSSSFGSYKDRFGKPCKSAPTRCDGGKTQCDC